MGTGWAAVGADYSWVGPAGFSSAAQNPVVTVAGSYSLTVSNPACPGALSTAVTTVISNTVAPVMSTSLVAKSCPTCSATVSADSPGAVLSWVGPGNFAALGADAQVVADGEYTVTATAANGCWVSARLAVVHFVCPEVRMGRDSLALCSGVPVDSIAALVTFGSHASQTDSVRFVVFSSPQSGTAMYGGGGQVLGTVKPDGTNHAVLNKPSVNTANNTRGVSEPVHLCFGVSHARRSLLPAVVGDGA